MMNDKRVRRVYEPPRAKDLSLMSATGGDVHPLGTCIGGNVPYTGCNIGTIVGGADCTVGNNVGVYPQCRAGSFAHSACLTGGAAG